MKTIFLDRDGVLNIEKGQYTFLVENFEILPGIIPVLKVLKQNGFLLIVITNQAGIAKGLYNRKEMERCHDKFQNLSGRLIDHFYVAPDHPDFSASLSRKPDSLLFEKAISKYDIDTKNSWMVGDKERDLIPAKKMGIQTVMIGDQPSCFHDFRINHPDDLLRIIL
jgi:D-glycero-D-manno-heptose 1,7-bisphosphate phosphatase